MKTLMLTAMQSGAGKTVLSCALLSALKRRGLRLQAFKCGPDYIDPMFHRSAIGVPCRNLDLFLQGEAGVKKTLAHTDADLGLIEGAMGYYDGVNGTASASAWEIARLTGTPAVLALSPKGSALTLAAQVRGMLDFRPESGIRALLLANCPETPAARFGPMLERETGLPVVGFLPPMEEAALPSRHLGLLTAAEIKDISARMERLAEQAAQSIDLDALLALAGTLRVPPCPSAAPAVRCRIAVARDEAFCFLYEDALDALREAGAELCFFSPLRDGTLPAAHGLYLPGGYPELYARRLAENRGMRCAVAEAVRSGLPTVAECGGFLYLQESLESEEGESLPMCAVLTGHGFRTGRLQRFGYQYLRAASDSLLFRAGERVPAHEFHYWDSTDCGASLRSEKPDGRHWFCGFASETMYAAFPHLHFGGEAPLAERFAEACEKWKTSMK